MGLLISGLGVFCALPVLMEVLNPHSFVNTAGAFIRSAIFAAGVPLWIVLSRRKKKAFLKAGIIVLGITAGIYLLYGVSCWRNSALYEESIRR